jgi:hypothetical protein
VDVRNLSSSPAFDFLRYYLDSIDPSRSLLGTQGQPLYLLFWFSRQPEFDYRRAYVYVLIDA